MPNAARIVDGVKVAEFDYRGSLANLPVQKGAARIVPIVEERAAVDAYRVLGDMQETVEADRVIKSWPAVPRPVGDVRGAASAEVDRQAEATRLLFITGGAGQALVYERKRDEATRWQVIVDAQGTPDPADFPMLKSRAERLDAATPDYQAVADEWTAVAAGWLQVAAAIEAIREGAKEAIEAAADTPAVIDIIAGLAWPSSE